MRTVWVAIAVFFVGALASIWHDQLEATLTFAGMGFGLVSLAESSFDWQRRITRRGWRREIFEASASVTIMGKVSQYLCYLCVVGFFVAHFG